VNYNKTLKNIVHQKQFKHFVFNKARAVQRHIVLTEGEDIREEEEAAYSDDSFETGNSVTTRRRRTRRTRR
jgi:hypothetical protein